MKPRSVQARTQAQAQAQAPTPAARAGFAVLAALCLAPLSMPAAAQGAPAAEGAAAPSVVGQRDIERALSAPRTRGLRIAPRVEAEPAAAPVASGLGSAQADTPTAPVESEPLPGSGTATPPASVALDIPFELGSSALRPSAAAQLAQLAAALRSEQLAPYRFLIAGHTDATGGADYNRRLSGRRADAVRRRLIDAGVAAQRLDARGLGEDEPLDPAHPNAAANRRVEIRNLGVVAP